jgi:hypothetical protein
MISIFASEGRQESPVEALDEMVAHANGLTLVGGKGPHSVQQMLIILNDRSGHRLAVRAN